MASPVQRRSIAPYPAAYNGIKADSREIAVMFEHQKEWEGQLINERFPLLQHLSGSDHSAVFLTELRGSEAETRKAVIKLVPADAATSSRQLARWSSAAVLSHRHLQKIFQSGRCKIGQAELLYLVMERPDENLAQVLPQRPLTAGEAQDMLQPVVEALAYLHGRNLAHGQLKPENILVAGDRLKLSSDHIALTGEPIAKNGAYEAPEVAATGASPAADVWSLGVTLAEALTQALPAWNGVEGADPELPRNFPAPFDEITSNCLRFNPELRCSAAEIIAHLQPPQAAAKPKLVPPPKSLTDAPSAHQSLIRWRYEILIAAIIFIAILVGSKTFSSRSARSQPPVAKALPQSAPVASQPAQNERPVAKPSPIPAAPETALTQGNEASTPPVAAPPTPNVVESPLHGATDNVVHQVLPDVPQSARNTINGSVRVAVRVQVDAAGNVVGASLDSPGPSKYFARLAQQASQEWKFAPAQSNGQSVPSEWLLRYAFGRSETTVSPSRVVP